MGGKKKRRRWRRRKRTRRPREKKKKKKPGRCSWDGAEGTGRMGARVKWRNRKKGGKDVR